MGRLQHATFLTLFLSFVCTALGQIRGVNLGGWFVTEQWITPSLYPDRIDDEWSLCLHLGKKKCHSTLRNHWNTFYTRDDFVQIRAAGLNAVRIPVGYWAVDVEDYEPYYPYLVRAVHWAQELGLSVLVDLHGAPGSQNGQDNSGLIGPVLFPANVTNAHRSLQVLRNFTREFCKDIYGDTVIGVELLNEPRVFDTDLSIDDLRSFNTQGYQVVRTAGCDHINVTVHDAFYGPKYWTNYDPLHSDATQPARGLSIDTHQYYAFEPLNNLTKPQMIESICNISQLLKQTSSGIPPTMVGEWSLQTGNTSNVHQDDDDDQGRRTWFRMLFEAQHAAYTPSGPGQSSIGWFFWTWKTEWDIVTWSYRRGIIGQWIPSDISNTSQLVYSVLDTGCIDLTSTNYSAPPSPTGGSLNGGSSPLQAHGSIILVLSMVALWSVLWI